MKPPPESSTPRGRPKRHKKRKNGWYIWDREARRPYFDRAWPTEQAARMELMDLLKYHTGDNPWQSRLSVVQVEPSTSQIEVRSPEGCSGGQTPVNLGDPEASTTGCIGFDVAMEGTADRARGACTPLTNGPYNCER